MGVTQSANVDTTEAAEFQFFQIAIRRHPDALMALSTHTVRKYANGDLPHGIRWMLQFPSLLRDLANLIEEAQQQKEGEGEEEKLRE